MLRGFIGCACMFSMYSGTVHLSINNSIIHCSHGIYVLFTITITIISHHYCSLIHNPQTRPPLSPNSYTFLGGRPLVHRAGENRETEPPPLLPKKNPRTHHPINIPIFPSLTHPPFLLSTLSTLPKSSQIMPLSSIISFSNDAAAIEKTLRGIQGLATIAIGFYQQQPQHTHTHTHTHAQIQGQMQGQIEMWIKLRGELALGMRINHHHHHP